MVNVSPKKLRYYSGDLKFLFMHKRARRDTFLQHRQGHVCLFFSLCIPCCLKSPDKKPRTRNLGTRKRRRRNLSQLREDSGCMMESLITYFHVFFFFFCLFIFIFFLFYLPCFSCLVATMVPLSFSQVSNVSMELLLSLYQG